MGGHGGAPGVHLRHGEGPRELSLLLQDRRVPARRPVLPPAQQASHLADTAAVQRVPAAEHDHSGVDAQGNPIDPAKIQGDFEDFYEDIFEELSKHGEVESLHVCDNLADHMIGNVYAQFREEKATRVLRALQGRFYAGRPIIAEFSPVTDFREATCRQFEENSCNRGGYCNFMHVKEIGRDLRRRLFGHLHRSRRSHSHGRSSSSRSRSPSPYRHQRSSSSWSRDRNEYYYYHGGSPRSSEKHHSSYDSDDSRRHRRSSKPSRMRSPVREGSEERRARIEQWNREREVAQA